MRSRLGRSGLGGRVLTLVHGLSLALGLATAWMALGPVSLYCLAFFAVFGALVVYLLELADESRVGYGAGVLAGVMAMAWVSLAFSFGVIGTLVVCVLVATTGPVRALWRRLGGRSDEPAEPDQAPRPRRGVPAPTKADETPPTAATVSRSARELPQLDLDTLCLVWRRSYFQLLDAGQTAGRAAVVTYRQRILDEIDHRDPRGMSRWLASGPRASGNPQPFLHTSPASDDRDAPGTPSG